MGFVRPPRLQHVREKLPADDTATLRMRRVRG